MPGLADRWIVTDDGLSYLFRLREGSWIGSAKLSAVTARSALMQGLAALRGTALGKDLRAAQAAAYAAVECIHFEGAHFRRDIADKAF